MMKNRLLATCSILMTATLLTACQSTQGFKPTVAKPTPTSNQANTPIKFAATGKIGIRTKTSEGTQGGSAFYAWSQEDNRFSIDLTGALGIGATEIRYNGTQATLNSERTGLISAASPEALLTTATGWHAPISQLPYWIVGRSAPSDTAKTLDNAGRIAKATNGLWAADFEYDKNNLPNRLTINHQDGHRVTMTINHQ